MLNNNINKSKRTLSYLFHNDFFNFLSLITVLSGERPIGRLVISKELISTIESLVRDAGFKSSYISRSKLIESFSFEGGENKWKCTPDDIEHIKNNNIYFYVSKNESDISKLIKHDEGYNIKRSGIALGYPSCCVKKYFNNIKELFKQINRLLSPNGILLITVPNLQAPEKNLFGNNWAAFDAPRHLYHFNPDSLKRLCKQYNFRIIRKYSLFQDTPYNILLSISKMNLLQLLKVVFVCCSALFQTIIRGPDYSSSFLFICKKY